MDKTKMYFRILSIACLLTFSVFFVGCASSNTPAPASPPPQQTTVNTTPPSSPPAAVTSPTSSNATTTQQKSADSAKITGPGPHGEGIKGHIDSKGVKIYHLPGDPYYNRTTHVAEWFFTEKDAQAAGYRPIKR